MRRGRIIIVALALLAVGASCLSCRTVFETVAEVVITPRPAFDDAAPPRAPDYSKAEAWLARPDMKDDADLDVEPAVLAQARPADVFFIYPTIYISRDHWNQPIEEALDDVRGNFMGNPIAAQATVFNACCNVYAPAYRQAAIATYLGVDDGPKALDLAYEDVKAAFEHYLEHDDVGRPLILAGHSQGGAHVMRLLQEYFSQKPLKERLVAAYMVGTPVAVELAESMPDIPVCASAEATGCILSWNTQKVGAEIPNWQTLYWARLPSGYTHLGERDVVCVNPLSWELDGERVEAEQNLGFVMVNEAKDGFDVKPGFADAACIDDRLQIHPASGLKDYGTGADNYHVFDYNLFYLNVRENAVARLNAWASSASGRGAARLSEPAR